MFLVAFNIVKDRSSAEDIVQDILIAVWEKRKNLVIQHSLKAYLFSSVRYASYKEWKRILTSPNESIESLELPNDDSPIEHLAYHELKNQISQVINDLPARCKEVYILSRENQLSHKEIAERMNISTKTVENQLTKALRILRLSLNNVPFVVILSQIIK